MPRLLLLSCLLIASRSLAQDARLELFEPPARQTVRGVLPLVEVEGRAWRGEPEPLDLVLALDVSESVFLPAGDDVDGDGVTGRTRIRHIRRSDGSHRPPRGWTTDPGDTVFEAEREAARRVLDALPSERTRVALLSFEEEVRVRARLGHAARARAALDALRSPPAPRSTDLARAIRIGSHLLREPRADGGQRVLLLLSDGHATRPGPPIVADAAARRAARAAARSGIAIHTVAVGPDAAGADSAYAELAALSRGRFAAARQLAALLGEPPFAGPPVPLVSVAITNTSMREEGRALRSRGCGSFDAFVRLAPGRNRLRVRALAVDGTRLTAFRTVYFDPPRALTAGDLELARTLHLRALEIELAGLAAGRRNGQGRLELEAER